MTELADVFGDLADPRAVNARRHSRHDILVIALGAIVCGGQTPGRDTEPVGCRRGAVRGRLPGGGGGGRQDPAAFLRPGRRTIRPAY